MRLLHRPAAGIVNRNGITGPIDKQLLAGLVFLPKHHFLFAPPALVQPAEARVTISHRAAPGDILPAAAPMLDSNAASTVRGSIRNPAAGAAAMVARADQRRRGVVRAAHHPSRPAAATGVRRPRRV